MLASQKRTVPSLPQLMIRLPSGVKRAERTAPVWPNSVRCSRHVSRAAYKASVRLLAGRGPGRLDGQQQSQARIGVQSPTDDCAVSRKPSARTSTLSLASRQFPLSCRSLLPIPCVNGVVLGLFLRRAAASAFLLLHLGVPFLGLRDLPLPGFRSAGQLRPEQSPGCADDAPNQGQ